jgi:MFS transporter, NNP family, nitrate/nitrite transporter
MIHSSSLGAKLTPLLFITTLFFTNFFARIVPAPLMPGIEADLGISHSAAGLLFLAIAIGYFITLIGSGLISSRITHRKTIILSAITLALACFAAASSRGLIGISVGLLLVGMASGLYLPSGIATLTGLISPLHWGKAIAVHELAPNLAFILAPLLSEVLLQWYSWRTVLACVGAGSFSIGIAFAFLAEGGDFRGDAPALSSLRSLVHERAFWIMIALFSLGIGATAGIYAMLPLYLVSERGINQAWTNTLVATSRIIPVFMALLSGWAADRFGATTTMTYVLFLTGTLTILLGIVPGTWVILPVFLQPMLAVCFFPAALATLSSIGPSRARSVVVSFTIPLSFLIGAGAIPALIGLLGSLRSFSSGIASAGALMALGAILTRFLQLPPRKSYGE